MATKKHFRVYSSRMKITVDNENVKPEELKEIEKYKQLGWVIVPQKKKEKKVKEVREITKEFNIHYDKVYKEEMIKYIKDFVIAEDKDALKKFAIASHKDKNGNFDKNKKGEFVYHQVQAKNYFYETYFPEKWKKEILPMLEERRNKKKEKNEAKKLEDELLELLK